MTLVVGLGNPGPEYAQTRHNFGFMVVDELASGAGVISYQEKFAGHVARAQIEGEPSVLLKPMTFMNLSGRSVSRAVQFFKLSPANIIVAHDELDLPFGTVRIKKAGGIAGHKGLASMKQLLGTADFIRVRMGIDRPQRGSVTDYVLKNFTQDETANLTDVIALGAGAVKCIIRRGVAAAMNQFNKRGEANES